MVQTVEPITVIIYQIYYTILYYTILYHTILYYVIIYYTVASYVIYILILEQDPEYYYRTLRWICWLLGGSGFASATRATVAIPLTHVISIHTCMHAMPVTYHTYISSVHTYIYPCVIYAGMHMHVCVYMYTLIYSIHTHTYTHT